MFEWLRRFLPARTCPTCGVRLERTLVPEEGYRQLSRRHLGSRVILVPEQVVPVYGVCPKCGYRVRRRNIRAPL